MKTLFSSMSLSEAEQWADCRETSIEIANVILENTKTQDEAQRVWESPTEFEAQIIELLAFDKTDDDELFWGCSTLTR